MIKKILNIISRAIIDNIPFFIILGILSLFGDKYEYIKSLRTILLRLLFQVLWVILQEIFLLKNTVE